MHLPKPGEGGNFTQVPGGNFPAICYRVVDLGTQESTFQGEVSKKHQVMISWELKDDECVMSGGQYDGQPMTMHKSYTWSMHEKATLRKHLEAWRGKPFKDTDFGPDGFDIRNLLGVPCMLMIVQNENGGKTYSNISGIAKLPKNLPVAELFNQRVYFSLDDFNAEVFESLSERLQERIKLSPEYQQMGSGKPAMQGGRAPVDDEIPFAPEWRG